MRCGSGVWREPIARCTSREAASSSAIWKPVFPPPTTSTRPGGMAAGLRYWVLWSWATSRSSPVRDRGDGRHLERPGGDHHLIRFVGAVVELDGVGVAVLPVGGDAAVELDRQVARVVLE